jgi:hypothetical protein
MKAAAHLLCDRALELGSRDNVSGERGPMPCA